MFKSIATPLLLVAVCIGQTDAQQTPKKSKSPERASTAAYNTKELQQAIDTIVNRFLDNSEKIIPVTNTDHLQHNAWHIDRMTEQINAMRRIEKVVSTTDRPVVTKILKKLESTNSQHLQQHHSDMSYLMRKAAYEIAINNLRSIN
jgi:hypothetical protein